MSTTTLDKTIPVKPPMVKRKMNPKTQKSNGENNKREPVNVASHLKILIPVGTAITIVAVIK